MKGIGLVYQLLGSWFSNGLKTIMLRKSLFWALSIIFYLKQESPPCLAGFLLRYLADSNRRPRFCRPIPNHSGKVPFCGCKDTTFLFHGKVILKK